MVAQYLRENRVVPEKNDLNSLLFLLTPGVEIEQGRHAAHRARRLQGLHDDNAMLDDVIPEFVGRRPQRYAAVRLRDLCADMHAFYRESGTSRAAARAVHARASAGDGDVAARGGTQLVRNNVDYLPIDEIEGRIATTLFVVYPPGIATIVPGERLDARARADDRLSQGVRARRQPVPGLRGRDPGPLPRGRAGRHIRFYTYVVRE